ncbi:MAG: hypothetical protein AAF485_14460 [Chloroflexota bacterium]
MSKKTSFPVVRYAALKQLLSGAKENPWLASTLLRRFKQHQMQMMAYLKEMWLWLALTQPRRAIKMMKRLVSPLLMGSGLVLLLNAGFVHAETITVVRTDDEMGNGDGCSLREAIVNANNDDQSGSTDCATGNGADTIILPAATINFSKAGRDEDLALTGDLDILTGTHVAIQGQGMDSSMIDAKQLDRVFHMHPDSTLTIIDTAITNGKVFTDFGGGIFNDEGALTVTNSKIFTNQVAYDGEGGGIGNRTISGTVAMTLTNSFVLSNSAVDDGGGIYSVAEGNGLTEVTIVDSTISGNKSGSDGGGIGMQNDDTGQGKLSISGTTFRYNETPSRGGVYIRAEDDGAMEVTITASTFTQNQAGSRGGALYIRAEDNGVTEVTITTSSFTQNQAGSSGGAIYSRTQNSGASQMTISGTTINDNQAVSIEGGGIYQRTQNSAKSSITITTSTISNNQTADDGGAIY